MTRDPIDYVIPSNDDAIRAIKLVAAALADAALEGRNLRKDSDDEGEEEIIAAGVDPYAEPAEIDDDQLLGESTLAKIRAEQDGDANTEAAEADEASEDAAAPEASAEA